MCEALDSILVQSLFISPRFLGLLSTRQKKERNWPPVKIEWQVPEQLNKCLKWVGNCSSTYKTIMEINCKNSMKDEILLVLFSVLFVVVTEFCLSKNYHSLEIHISVQNERS